jgi:hypothetical protein
VFEINGDLNMAENGARLTIRMSKEFKETLAKYAEAAKPPTSTSRLALYLIELGLREYTEELKETVN